MCSTKSIVVLHGLCIMYICCVMYSRVISCLSAMVAMYLSILFPAEISAQSTVNEGSSRQDVIEKFRFE